jgi:autotransporter-associated beta strand protein
MKTPRISGLIRSHLTRWFFGCSAAIFIGYPTIVNAADYTWDTNSTNGATIDAGSGNWNTTATNWNSAGSNLVWAQTSGSAALHNAIFAGADGTYTVTLSGITNAQSVAFNNSGYTLTSGTLSLQPTTTTSGSITVAANKTATINSAIGYSLGTAGGGNSPATLTINSGATLNLGGGASNAQYTFAGAGTVNMTAGTYSANIGTVGNPTFNQSGGTFNITPGGNGNGYIISSAAQNVAYNLSGGALSVIGQATGTSSHLGIGNTTGTAFTSTLNVSGSGTLVSGTTAGRSGEIQIAKTGSSNGTLNVSGGTVTVGTGTTANKIYFFKAGSNPGYTANMTQSGGTVTANGIQFGGTSGTYNASSAANLTLSGGSLYVGLQGITSGSAASALPYTIKLEGGTIGASDTWTSSLNMQLGTAGGGVTVRAQDATTVGRNITLSGHLSNVSGVNGTLTKAGAADLILSGSNSYSGGTTINAGRLFIGGANALPATGAVTVNAGTLALNAAGSPAFNQSITLNTGSNLSMRQAATLSNVTLPTSGIVSFNNDDVTTQPFSLGSNVGLTGNLDIRVGGGAMAPGNITLTGIISGTGGNLTKSGMGTLTLTGPNTYTGATIIGGGSSSTLALGASNVLPDTTNVTIGIAKLNAATFSDIVGTLDVTAATSTINLGSGATLAFADSSAVDWTGGTLNITGTFVSGTSLRFGTTSGGLTSTQLSQITATGVTSFALNASGYLIVGTPDIAVEQPAGTDIANNGTKDFGRVGLGLNNSLTFTVRNAGSAALSLLGTPLVVISGTNAADFTVTANPTTPVAAGGTTTFTVRFAPNGVVGPRSATLFISNNDSDENPYRINLSGTAAEPPEIAIEEPVGANIVNGGERDFGSVGQGLEKTLTFTIRNSAAAGAANLNLTTTPQVAVSGANAADFTVTSEPDASVAAAGTTTFIVRFAPSGVVGARSAQLSIANDDSDETPFVINLSGTCISVPEIAIEKAPGTNIVNGGSHDFGSLEVGIKESLTFTVRNTGSADLNLTGTPRVDIIGTEAADFTVTTPPNATIVPGGNTTFTVEFAPSESGPRSAQISIANNDSNENPFVINLGGKGVGPQEITVEQPAETDIPNNGSKDFGLVQAGTPKTLTFTVRNSGDLPLSLTGVPQVVISGTNAADFTVTADPDASVGPQGTTTFEVQFIPSARGARSAQLSIANDDSNEDPFVINLSGSGILPADIAVEQPAGNDIANNGTKDFGTVGLGLNNSLTFTVRNIGDLPLDLEGVPRVVISGADKDDFTVTANPNYRVPGVASTTFTVQFAPSASPGVGSRSAKLSIDSNDSDENPFVINLTGEAVLPPEIAVEQPEGTNIPNNGSQDFLSVLLDSNISHTFTIRNSGDLPLNLSGTPQVAISGTNAADFTVTTQPSASIAADGATTFTVQFTPSVRGPRSAKLSIANNDTNEDPFVINLSGTAVLPPDIAVEQPAGTNIANNSTKDFGSVGQGLEKSLTFTIRNSGDLPLSLSGPPRVVISGTNAADFTVTTQPNATIEAAGTTTFTVKLALSASAVVGPRSAQLSIANNDSDKNPFVIKLSGTAVLPPEIAVEQPVGNNIATSGTQAFGNVGLGLTNSLTFTIRNSAAVGAANLNLTGTPRVVVSGTNSADFTVTTQPSASVAAAGSTTFTVRFAPSVSVGARIAQLSIANDDSDENPFVINLSGTAVLPPEIAVEQPAGTNIANNGTKDFGIVGLGLTNSLTFTISNSGDLPLSLTNTPQVAIIGTNAADFTITTQPSASVVAKGSTTFTVRFAPSVSVGARIAQLSIANDDSDENPFVINLSGTAVLPPEIAIEQPVGTNIANNGTKDFGTVGLGLTNSLTFTISNSGDLPLSLTNTPQVAIIGTNAADFTITTQPSASVVAKGSTTFTVRFAPSVSVGARSAQLSIANNDITDNENPFVINLSGTAVLPPEIALEQPAGTNIANNGTKDFGTVGLGLTNSLTFTISNSGDLPLILTNTPQVAIIGTNAADFTITTQPSASVVAKGSTTFTVRFAPSISGVVGARSAQVSIANNDSDENPFVINLSGTAVLPPEIAIEQPVGTNIANNGTKDFGIVGLGLTNSLTFTISNSGDLPLSLTNTPQVAIIGTNAADFTITTQPSASVVAKGSTTFTVRFAPSISGVVGARSAQLSIANNDITDNENPFVINLTGTAVLPPEIAVAQPVGTDIANSGTKDFGQVGLGLGRSLTFTISNSGDLPLSLSGTPRVAITGTNAADFTVTAEPTSSVAAKGSTTFTVKFAPSAVLGSRTAKLSIANNDITDNENPFVINLTGEAVWPPDIAVEQPAGTNIANNGTQAFGSLTVGSSKKLTFTVRNTGSGGLLLTGRPRVAISGDEDDFLVISSPVNYVASGGSTFFVVEFNPRAAGPRNAVLSIENNDFGDEDPFVINLSGTGTGAPEIAVEQAGSNIVNSGTQSFGKALLGSYVSQTFTILNEGDVTLSLTGSPRVAISGHADDFLVTASPSSTVTGYGSTTFTVQFVPRAAGVRSAKISIANNDSNENPYEINLSGTGDAGAPEIAVEQAGSNIDNNGSQSFGTVAAGSTKSLTFTIRNRGNVALNLNGSPRVDIKGTDAARFQLIASPAASVPVGGSTSFTVQFSPGFEGPHSAYLSIANNDNTDRENPFLIDLSANSAAEIAVEEPVGTRIASNGSKDFGSVLLGGKTELTFTIRNIGGESLNLTGTPRVAISGTNAGDFKVSTEPSASVAAAGSTTFTVSFAPSVSVGTRTATLSIANNDSDENPFVINLSGKAGVVYGSDNASATNYPGGTWTNGSNGGSGFGPWTIASSNGTSGFAGAFIGNPATAGITGIANPSFGLYANPSGSGATVTVSRSFNLPLGVGDSFSFQWATNWDSDGGNKGFNIFAGGSQIVNVNQASFPGNITFNGALAIDGSTGYGSAPMTWTFTRTTETNLEVTSTARNGSSTIAFTSNITLTSAPTGFSFYSTAMGAGDARQPYFNNLQLTKFATIAEPLVLASPINPFDDYMASFSLFDEDALGTADPATISGNVVTTTGAGIVAPAANQASNANYSAATEATASFDDMKAAQSIAAFTPIPNKMISDGPFAVAAPVASSGLPVSMSVKSGSATISNNIMTVTEAGIITIAANQPGNDNYNPATEVTTNIVVLGITSDLKETIITSGKLMPRYVITNNFDAKEYTARGLPPGIKINKNTGVISGKTKKKGTYNVTITATKRDKNKKILQSVRAVKVFKVN